MAEIPKQEKTVYQLNGFRDRAHYLLSLARQYDVDYQDVAALADMLGEDEDFDGLVTSVEDHAEGRGL